MPSEAWVVTCTGCKCVITCFAIDPQLEHGRADVGPPQESAVVICPCCGSAYRYSARGIVRDVPRRNPQCGHKVQSSQLNGALLVAASIVAVIRLKGAEITPSPRLKAVVNDSIFLAKTILAHLEHS
jgi:hypothetical protein